MELPKHPLFVEPYRDESGGVDFLGLRQVNLDLMDQFMPGINNVTKLIRPYSLITWTAWKFIEASKALKAKQVTAPSYKHFREKIELLFTWGHQLNGAGVGLVGNSSKCPEAHRGVVPLEFDAWQRNVSLLDAVNYGPSLKTDNGLGFLRQVKSGLFGVTDSGYELAEALDARIEKSAHATRLANLGDVSGTEAMAEELYKAWNVRKPSQKEKSVFGRTFYTKEAIGKDSRLGRRSSAVELILTALRYEDAPMTEWDIRRTMAFGTTLKGKRFQLNESLQETNKLWVALQIRQAQRMALEALFAWVEHQVIVGRQYLSSQLAEAVIEQLSEGYYPLPVLGSPAKYLARLEQRMGNKPNLLVAGVKEKDMDIDLFHRMWTIEENTHYRESIPSQSLEVLLMVALMVQQFEGDSTMRGYFQHGAGYRISMAKWAEFVFRNQNQPLQSFLSSLIENYLLSQHFGVAASRYETGKQRLRLTIEERGLVPMIGENDIWEPTITPDRLNSALSLMTDYGVLKQYDDEYALA